MYHGNWAYDTTGDSYKDGQLAGGVDSSNVLEGRPTRAAAAAGENRRKRHRDSQDSDVEMANAPDPLDFQDGQQDSGRTRRTTRGSVRKRQKQSEPVPVQPSVDQGSEEDPAIEEGETNETNNAENINDENDNMDIDNLESDNIGSNELDLGGDEKEGNRGHSSGRQGKEPQLRPANISSSSSSPPPISNGVFTEQIRESKFTHLKTSEEYELFTKITAKPGNDFSCVTELTATFSVKGPKDRARRRQGQLLACLIDRKISNKNTGTSLFIEELLAPGPAARPLVHHNPANPDHENLNELQISMQHIFSKHTGFPHPELSAFTPQLSSPSPLIFIPSFWIHQKFFSTGLAQAALQSFLSFLPSINFTGTVTLSPAGFCSVSTTIANRQEKAGERVKTYAEVEKALIGSYRKSGFRLYEKSDDELTEGGISIMGQTMEEFRQWMEKQKRKRGEEKKEGA